MPGPLTLSQKVWANHLVREEAGAPSLIYVDLHLVHEVTSPQAFSGLRERGLKVRRPDLTIATTDHSIPTTDRSLPILDPIAANQVAQLATNCRNSASRTTEFIPNTRASFTSSDRSSASRSPA
jgi:3-isopropylmalate/(R)-2-methylmalate dehydratase large subunit